MLEPRSILVIKPSSLGDVVHTLPAVACVKKRWPAAKLSWLVNPEWAPLLEGNPHVDEVIHFPRGEFRGIGGLTGFPKWVKSLRQRIQPDLVLDFQGLLRSGLVAKGVGGQTWGMSDSREGARMFHQHIVPVPPREAPFHAVNRYLALTGALGCMNTGALEWPLPQGSEPPGLPREYIVLHPFSRGEGKSLAVPEVLAICAAAPIPVVLAGRTEEVIPPMNNVVNLLNRTTLPELCHVLCRARFTVSVDSGPMHIAAALHPRLLAIHTWSEPRRVGPWCQDAWVWKDGAVGKMRDFPEAGNCPRESLPQWIAENC